MSYTIVQCISGPEFLHDELITVYVSVFADIVTDIMRRHIFHIFIFRLLIANPKSYQFPAAYCGSFKSSLDRKSSLLSCCAAAFS